MKNAGRLDDTAGLILAGGAGHRMGTAVPKQYLDLGGGSRVIDFSVRTFLQHLGEVVIVLPDLAEAPRITSDPRAIFVRGGRSRTDSVRNGLTRVTRPHVLVHDAARPFVDRKIIDDVRGGLAESAAVCPVVPVTSTLVREDDGLLAETPDRGLYREIQTPQGFRTASLNRALEVHGDEHAHLPELVRRLGESVFHVPGSPWLFKLTYEPSIYAARQYATGKREALQGGEDPVAG